MRGRGGGRDVRRKIAPSRPAGSKTGARLPAGPAPNPRAWPRRQVVIPGSNALATGAFECPPGICRRNVKEWETMFVLSGSGAFAPVAKDTIEFGAGDARMFAASAEGP
ncbi:cupin domain-containing protein [Burkholderia anthina]|uniref:cupin domain-containing protein n=1 Tax=Burkholderia anthina TaxID=179879 RepID=UPI0037C1A5BA